jgi:hypothetical protein
MTVGLLAIPPDMPADLARRLEKRLPGLLSRELGDQLTWVVDTGWGTRNPAAEASLDQMIAEVHDRAAERDWDVTICLTDVPVREDGHPVLARSSRGQGVALVSLPALGVVRQQRDVENVIILLVVDLLKDRLGDQLDRDLADRLRREVQPAHRVREDDDGLTLFGSARTGTLRLLAGMVVANRPWRVMNRLSRLTLSALVTGAASLTQSTLWQLSGALGAVRLTALTVISSAALVITLIVMHGLWEHAADSDHRDRVRLFNIATLTTLTLGVTISYVARFVMILLAAALVLVPPVLSSALHHPVGLRDYLLLAWFTSSLATVGGAIGSAAESDVDVRAAAYGYHPDRPDPDGSRPDERSRTDERR